MSANATMIAVLVLLAAAALAVRVIAGPMADLGEGTSLYAAAKYGSAPGPLSDPVMMAVSGAPPAR